MKSETNDSGSSSSWTRGRLWRTILYPLLVIAVIAAAIWWLEYRPGQGVSSTGDRYGPVELPLALVPAEAKIQPEEGALAPDFLLETLDGDELRLSDLRGQPVMVNFWATWCSPCRKEVPQLVAAYDSFRDQGLEIVAVNLQESSSIVREFAEDFGMEFPIVMERDGRMADRYRLLGLPTTIFIDRLGVVRSVFFGPLIENVQGTNVQGAINASELEKRIAEILD